MPRRGGRDAQDGEPTDLGPLLAGVRACDFQGLRKTANCIVNHDTISNLFMYMSMFLCMICIGLCVCVWMCIWISWGQSGPFWGHSEPILASSSNLGQSGPSGTNLEQSGPPGGQSGPIWGSWNQPGPIRLSWDQAGPIFAAPNQSNLIFSFKNMANANIHLLMP